jgi:hypothetical protein
MALTEAWTAGPTAAPTDEDRAAVRATVLDYFEGWFDGDEGRMRRALHPALSKRSYAQDLSRTAALSSVTADQMIAWAAAGLGRERTGPDRKVEVRIDEVSGPIASVTVHTDSYDEFVHLACTRDGWRIVNTLWRYADGHGPLG